jgi:acetyltransferase-like isoleucine patch superfamily enzyme
MADAKPPVELSPEQLDQLIHQVNHALLTRPRIWGETRRVVLGNNVHLANTLFNTSSGMIIVGDDSFFGHNVCLLTGTHDYRKRGKARQASIPDIGRDIFIGQGVWISTNVTIIGPCTIGDHAVIAAGAVVCGGELPGGHIYAGAPAKPIKAIDFDDAPEGAA